MVRIHSYAVYDKRGGLTRYSSFEGFLKALERDGLSIDSDTVRIYCTSGGVMIADCY